MTGMFAGGELSDDLCDQGPFLSFGGKALDHVYIKENKEELSMSRTQRKYDHEYKIQAVKLAKRNRRC